ncbi:MAG: hypothetical protein ACQEP3_03605, partial [Patescibacteria group bacterium]
LELLMEEAVSVGAEEIVFLTDKKEDERLVNFFQDLDKKVDYLKKRGNSRAKKLSKLKEKFKDLEFSFVSSFTEAVRGADDFAYISSEKLIYNEKNSLTQLMEVFKTSERPVLGLTKSDRGDIKTEKIARGLYKLKGFTDESVLSTIGRGVFTSESRKFFQEAESLREAIENMMERGHTVYGTKVDGKVFTVNNENSYLKANIYYSLKNKDDKELEEFIKDEELL